LKSFTFWRCQRVKLQRKVVFNGLYRLPGLIPKLLLIIRSIEYVRVFPHIFYDSPVILIFSFKLDGSILRLRLGLEALQKELIFIINTLVFKFLPRQTNTIELLFF